MSETEKINLTAVKELFESGMLETALKQIVVLENRNNLLPKEQTDIKLVKSDILNGLARYEEALYHTGEVLLKLPYRKIPLQKLDALIIQAEVFLRIGNLEKCIQKIKRGEDLLLSASEQQSKDILLRKASLLNFKAEYYWSQGDLDQSLIFFNQSLEIREKFNCINEIVGTLSNIGVMYILKGDLKKAIDFLERALAFPSTNKMKIAAALHNLGTCYSRKGDLDLALCKLKKSNCLFTEIGNNQLMAASFDKIAEILFWKSETKQSIEYFERSLKLSEEFTNPYYTSNALFWLIRVCLDNSLVIQAQEYLSKLRKIDNENFKVVNQRLRVAEALILKTSIRSKHWSKAEELLESVIEEDIIDHVVTEVALISLCELLLSELKESDEEEDIILKELETHSFNLLKIAKDQQSHWLMAEVSFLQSKIVLVKLDFARARHLLTQAEYIAQQYGLIRLTKKMTIERDGLLENFKTWQKLKIDKNSPLEERLKLSRLETAVKQMINDQDGFISDKHIVEKPIVILLLSSEGNLIFSRDFTVEKRIKVEKLSGFILGINVLSREVFDVSGYIERLKHQDYTLIINSDESLIICYGYQGDSYTAQKHIDEFINYLKTTIWMTINEIADNNEPLNDSVKEELDIVAKRIFINQKNE